MREILFKAKRIDNGEWDNPWGVVEYETYKEYAEPLFKNLEDQHEVRRSRKDRKE